jgi:hypothetical protein
MLVIDEMRHIANDPYDLELLHKEVAAIGIKRCWFHRDHYDAPKKRFEELKKTLRVVSPREMLRLVRGV